jgi:hypothetical protein
MTLKGENFIFGKSTVDIKFTTNVWSIETTGSIVDSQTIEMEYTFPDASGSEKDVSIQVSFDGKNSWQTTGLLLRTFGLFSFENNG